MTKKDYQLIAGVLNGRRENTVNLDKFPGWSYKDVDTAIAVINDTCYFMAHALRHDNAKFDTQRFLQACGIESDKVTIA